jgi:hypothetical protein
MRHEARKNLYDIKQAADLLGEFTAGASKNFGLEDPAYTFETSVSTTH